MADHYLSAEILMDMTKSIANVEAYSDAIDGLDTKLGSLEGKLNALSSSLNKVSSTKGANLRQSIEKQISDAIKQSGVVLEGVGDGALKVDKKTINAINNAIQQELNRELAEQSANIKMKIDPGYKKAFTTKLDNDQFDSFNKEIANMVNNQMKSIGKLLKEYKAEGISPEDLAGQNLKIGKSIVQSIIKSVKTQIEPILAKPEVSTEGVVLHIDAKETKRLANKIAKQITDNMANSKVQTANIPNDSLSKIHTTISGLVSKQIGEMNKQLKAVNLGNIESPINDLNKRTRQIIADNLNVPLKELDKANIKTSNGEIAEIRIKDAFDGLNKEMNKKLGQYTGTFAKSVIDQIKTVSFEVQPSIAHELNSELARINKTIVQKIKQQVDIQIAHIIDEIEAASSVPLNLNSRNVNSLNNLGQQLRPKSQRISQTTNIINNYGGSGGSNVPKTSILNSSANDPYARRDNHFNSMGMEGALKNTLRHIVAGSMVGAPIMAIYEAMNTFKETQLEMLKAYQNYYMQSYVGNDGEVNKGLIEAEIKELNDVAKKMSVHYGIDYTSMSEVATIASRVTENEHQSKYFMDAASQILRLDNSGDLVKDIAPGLEAIMLQFGMSVYELNKVVASFAVVSNVTKASTKELMEGLSRSGASFKAAGITMEQAAVFMGGAIQSTGLTAPDLGNMFKTMNTRLTMPKVEKALAEQGVDVYDEYGNRKSGVELYQAIADIVTNPNTSNRTRDALLLDTAGMYQVNKFNAFIQSMNTANVPVSDEDGKYYKQFNLNDQLEAVNFENEEAMRSAMMMVHDLLAESLDNPAISMDRAGVAVNVALTSMLEELSPQIQRLADVIVNASDTVQNNSERIAELGAALFNAAVGFGAMKGIQWGINKGGYQGHLENYKTQDKLYGARNGSSPSTVAPLMGLFGTGLSDIANRNANSFKILDMMSASPHMAGVMNTLANMDEDTVKRTMQYNEDFRGGKKVNSMGELSSLLAESQNYFVPDMDENTRKQRSMGTIGDMISRDSTAQMFASTFADELKNFDMMTATPETRRMFESMARMNDVVAADFESFIARDTVRNGTRIDNVGDLTNSYNRYRQFQADNIDSRFANDIDAHRINNRYNDLISEANGQNPNAQAGGGLAGFMTTTGNAARSFGKSLLDLGKSAGKLAGQFAALMALGSVITEWIENSMLTEKQRDVRSIEKDVEHISDMHKLKTTLEGDGSWIDKGFSLTGALTSNLTNMVLDLIPGIDRRGLDDALMGDLSADKYRDALKKLYGTANTSDIINNSYDEETGTYRLNEDKILASVLGELGLNDKLDSAKYEEYEESYFKHMDNMEQQLVNQQKAEQARDAYNKGLLENSPNRINMSELFADIEAQLEGIDGENKLSELTALIGGMQTTSQDYFNMMIDNINRQMEVYDKSLAHFDSYIRELEENMKILEDEGLGKGDNQQKYDLYSGDLADTKRKRQELEEEYELERKELELEKRRLEYAKRKQSITDRQNDFSDQEFYEDLATEMTTGEGTVDRGRSMRSNIDSQLQREKEILSMYEELAQWDMDGETDELIREQKRKIAEFNKQYFETYQQDLSSYTKNVGKVESKNSIEMLRAQVSSGITDANDPALKGIRMSLLGKELTAINTELARAQATMADLISQGADPTTLNDYEDTIIDLERQSLEVQLEQLSEMKTSKGTFNLPDGLKVMTELDYKMGQSSHSQYSFQQGETYVTVVLPNVTGTTNQNTVNNIGRSLGSGISSGRINSYRAQISSNPNSYRVLT